MNVLVLILSFDIITSSRDSWCETAFWEWVNNQQKYVGCASTKLICISDQDRSKFLHPSCLVTLSTKFPCVFLALPLLCLYNSSSAGEKRNLGLVFALKILFYIWTSFSVQNSLCTETLSALKCQHFPFLELVSFEEHLRYLQHNIEECHPKLYSMELPQCIAHLAAQTRLHSGQEHGNQMRT